MNNGDLKGLIISFTNKVYTDRYSHARHVTVTLGGLNGRKKTGKKVFFRNSTVEVKAHN